MPLVPSSSATPTRKEKATQFPENAGSSWSRLWIAQHPPKASKAEVTVQAPSLVGAEERYPSLSAVEHISPLHQILPLYPLPSIAELPKQEAPSGAEAKSEPRAPQELREAERSTVQESDQVIERRTSELMDDDKKNIQDGQEVSRGASILSSSPIVEAANVPLPTSPASEDSPDSFGSEDGLRGAQELNPRSGELTAGTAESFISQPSRRDTGMANTRASRSSSVAPGAYPESDSTEESFRRASGPTAEDQQAENAQSKVDPPRPDDKGVRSRKSVSIVLPDARTGTKTAQAEHTDSIRPPEDRNDTISELNIHNEREHEAKEYVPEEDITGGRSDPPSPPEAEKVSEGPRTSAKAGKDMSVRPLEAPTQRDASVISRTSSVAPSQDETDKTDISTLHERESIAPSDADNSSLKPLLSSSRRARRSSHFSESLDESRTDPTVTESGKKAENTLETSAHSPPIVDDLSGLSTTDSSNSSKTGEDRKHKPLEYPFPPVDIGEGSSKAASSLPPPKIVVRDASSAESPPLVAPTTTPVQDGSTPPRRQTTFIALGESSNHESPVKLPIKRRKLYVRKARYAFLRQPILNAALGRQVGAQAKQALKKLADGELIVVKPPTSL
ncbi:MAG: hypothetical protein Q9166_004468 [cf. Caloplaca sp. 2 TL-2023]